MVDTEEAKKSINLFMLVVAACGIAVVLAFVFGLMWLAMQLLGA